MPGVQNFAGGRQVLSPEEAVLYDQDMAITYVVVVPRHIFEEQFGAPADPVAYQEFIGQMEHTAEFKIFMQLGESTFTANHLFRTHAFYWKVLAIKVPEGVEDFEEDLRFCDYYDQLEEIKLPSTLTQLGSYLFLNQTKLNAINIPEGVTEIPTACFAGCRRLKKAVLPPRLTRIAEKAFCLSGITIMHIPASVQEIADSAFKSCQFLRNVIFAKASRCQLRTIGAFAFIGTCLRRVRIPPSVEHIGRQAFLTQGGPNHLQVVYFEGRLFNFVRLFLDLDLLVGADPRLEWPWASQVGRNRMPEGTPAAEMNRLRRVRFDPRVMLVLCDNPMSFRNNELKAMQFPGVDPASYGRVIPPGFNTLGRMLQRMNLLNPSEIAGFQTHQNQSYTDIVNLFGRPLPGELMDNVLDQRPSALWFDAV